VARSGRIVLLTAAEPFGPGLQQRRMTSLVSVLALGFLFGLRHAIDPDHVVAVSTIVSRERRIWTSSIVGALWGLGHTATIVVVGTAILMFKLVISPRVGGMLEFGVALMLILLGALSLSTKLPRYSLMQAPADAWPGDGPIEVGLPRTYGGLSLRAAARPIVVGIVHGLAGSATLALVVLSTIHSPFWGLLYLAVFGVGTGVGMILLTTAVALPFVYTARRFQRLNTWLGTIVAFGSIALGVIVALLR
jgi:ABC-type nickel/cobalt efflux system permease component RcnA